MRKEEDSMYCSKCGKKNQENAKFCSSCGNDVLTGIGTREIISKQDKRKESRPKYKGGVFAVIVVLLFVVIFFSVKMIVSQADFEVPTYTTYEPDARPCIFCYECDGEGVVVCPICYGTTKHLCPYCRGEGKIPCEACDGIGMY